MLNVVLSYLDLMLRMIQQVPTNPYVVHWFDVVQLFFPGMDWITILLWIFAVCMIGFILILMAIYRIVKATFYS